MAFVDITDARIEFPVYSADTRSLRASLLHHGSGGRLRREAGKRVTVLALDGLTLRAESGDRIGLVGRNGSGKSTLLRMIAGIYQPVYGRIEVSGRVSALLSGWFGVDQDLTGLEAIDYGCLLQGLSQSDIERVKPDIIEFSELGDYLSVPVRTYSAGMKVRLSFSIATCFVPDILLIDEAIGAGDAHFFAKARKRALEFIGRSHILFFASHSFDMMREVCNKAILLEHGRATCIGTLEEVLHLYAKTIAEIDPPAATPTRPPAVDAALAAWQGQLHGIWMANPKIPVGILALPGASAITQGRYHLAADGTAQIELTLSNGTGQQWNETHAGRFESSTPGRLMITYGEFREVFALGHGGLLLRIESNRPTWETRLELCKS